MLHQLDIAMAGSNPLVTKLISLYGFNFGKYKAVGFLQVVWYKKNVKKSN